MYKKEMDSHFEIYELQNNVGSFLEEMLYEAIWVKEGEKKPPRTITNQKFLRKYIANWGRYGDFGLIVKERKLEILVAAIWLRLFAKNEKSFGFVSEEVPELSMAVISEYRGKGIGTALIKELIIKMERNFSQISLSVDPENPAVRLYKKIGFKKVGVCGTSDTLLLDL